MELQSEKHTTGLFYEFLYRPLQDDFCYQIAGPHYLLNLLHPAFQLECRGEAWPLVVMNDSMGAREVEEAFRVEREGGREKEKERNSFSSFCDSNRSFVHHHHTHIGEREEGAVTALTIFRVQIQYDVIVLCLCLLI